MPNTPPPIRADMVGSLLRTAPLKDARAKHAKGEITPAQLKAVEDEEIKKIVRKQEEVGLKLATDGEFRRSWWHFDFFWHLTGCERVSADQGIQFHGVQTKAESLKVTGKLDFPADHPMLEHFKFLKANTKVTPKMTIPSPSVMHFRGGRKAISKDVYPEMGAYFDDLGKLYGKAIKAFYDAGCRYLQLDDTVWAYLCSKEQLEQARAARRGRRQAGRHLRQGHQHGAASPSPPTWPSPRTCAAATSAPPGSRRAATSRWPSCCWPASTTTATSWSTTPSAPAGWSRCASCPRARSAWWWASSPPRAARWRRRTTSSAASTRPRKYAPLDQLCLRPSAALPRTEEGNVLAEDEQWAKLKMIVDISREVWKS